MIKGDLPVKIKKLAIAIQHIEADAELELTKTNRAKEQWPGVALPQVIGPVQDAPEEDAMRQGEHVGGLVNQDLAASPQQDLRIIPSPRLTIESRIITGKAEDPDSLPEGRLAENEIPRRFGIEILHSDRQEAEAVGRKLPFEQG
jgi:hypothetical protein